MVNAWIWAIWRDVGPDFQIMKNSSVCSRHFKDSDYKTTLAGKRKLNNDAVPSILSRTKTSPKKQKLPHSHLPAKSVQNTQKRNTRKNYKWEQNLRQRKTVLVSLIAIHRRLPCKKSLKKLEKKLWQTKVFPNSKKSMKKLSRNCKRLATVWTQKHKTKSIGKRADWNKGTAAYLNNMLPRLRKENFFNQLKQSD